jgi:hypothetical protein
MGSRELAKSEAMGLWAKPYEGVKAINHRLYGSGRGVEEMVAPLVSFFSISL